MRKITLNVQKELSEPFQQLNINRDVTGIIFDYALECEVEIINGDLIYKCKKIEVNDKYVKIDLLNTNIPWAWHNYFDHNINYSLFGHSLLNLHKKEIAGNCIVLSTQFKEVLCEKYKYLPQTQTCKEIEQKFEIISDYNSHSVSYYRDTDLCRYINFIRLNFI